MTDDERNARTQHTTALISMARRIIEHRAGRGYWGTDSNNLYVSLLKTELENHCGATSDRV